MAEKDMYYQKALEWMKSLDANDLASVYEGITFGKKHPVFVALGVNGHDVACEFLYELICDDVNLFEETKRRLFDRNFSYRSTLLSLFIDVKNRKEGKVEEEDDVWG